MSALDFLMPGIFLEKGRQHRVVTTLSPAFGVSKPEFYLYDPRDSGHVVGTFSVSVSSSLKWGQ